MSCLISPLKALNRTKLELKPCYKYNQFRQPTAFKSHQIGIETKKIYYKMQKKAHFKSHQIGIET